MGLTVSSEGWTLEAAHTVTTEIVVRRGLLDAKDTHRLVGEDRPRGRLAVIDTAVERLHHARVHAFLHALPGTVQTLIVEPRESTKMWASVETIVGAALAAGVARGGDLIGVGGGNTLDLVGTAAAWLWRGIPYIVVPTTLVAMIDAGPALKRGVNWRDRKNLLGAYHPPRKVLADPDILMTLEPRQIREGLAEAKKVGEVVDPDLFRVLEEHGRELITTGCAGPAGDEMIRRAQERILQHHADNPFERNQPRRSDHGHHTSGWWRWPDHGHHISPRVEGETGGHVSHGEAVAICCALGSAVAVGRGLVSLSEFARMIRLSDALGLPTWHPLLDDSAFRARAIAAARQHRDGSAHWIVPKGIGGHDFVLTTEDEIARAVDRLRDRPLFRLGGNDDRN